MALRIRPATLLILWLGCWVLAFTLTHLPFKPGGPSPIPHIDKVGHVGLYFLVTYLGGLRLFVGSNVVKSSALAAWALIYLVYGIADELTQSFTGREPDFGDWVFDAFGVGLATLVLWRKFIPARFLGRERG